MTLTAHDFTRPLPLAPSLRVELTQWLGRTNALAAEQFVGMSVPVEFRVGACMTTFASESLSKWSDKSVAFNVVVEGHDQPSVIAVPNPLMLEIVSRMLGESPEAVAEERSLSAIEQSVSQFFVETLVKCLNESWLGVSALTLKVAEAETNLRRTRHFRPTEAFVDCQTQVKTPLGDSHWNWFLSLDFLTIVFGLPTRTQSSHDRPSRQLLEALIRSMQAEIVVRLGSVQLSGPQLATLRVGDLVVLDQRVSEPLRATIRGEPKFMGWAGRVGDRQAFEIGSEIKQSRATAVTGAK